MLRLRITDSMNLSALTSVARTAASATIAMATFTGRHLSVAVAPQLAEQLSTGADMMVARLRLLPMLWFVIVRLLMTPAVQLPPCPFLKHGPTGALRVPMTFAIVVHNLRRLTFAFSPKP